MIFFGLRFLTLQYSGCLNSVDSTCTAVRLFGSLVRRSGTHCQMNSEIRRVMSTASNSALKQSSSALTSVTSALEVIFNVMRSINPRFTYLLTCLLTCYNATYVSTDVRMMSSCVRIKMFHICCRIWPRRNYCAAVLIGHSTLVAHPFVYPSRNWKTERCRKTKICVNVHQGTVDRCASFQLKSSDGWPHIMSH